MKLENMKLENMKLVNIKILYCHTKGHSTNPWFMSLEYEMDEPNKPLHLKDLHFKGKEQLIAYLLTHDIEVRSCRLPDDEPYFRGPIH